MGNTGTKGDLKEQAQRHCHAHSTATTLLGATSAPRTPCRDWGGFSSREQGRLCHPALPHPSTSPSLTPAARGAPWGAEHTPQSPSSLPGARKAAGSTHSWGSGCCSMACLEQDGHLDLGVFWGKGLCTKPSRQPKLDQRLPSSSPAKTKLTKLHGNDTFGVAQPSGSSVASSQCTRALLTLIVSPLNVSSMKPNHPACAGGSRAVPSALPSASDPLVCGFGSRLGVFTKDRTALSSSSHTALYSVTAPCTIASQFLVQMWFWNRMASALWHFNASLMSVIYPPRNIFLFSPGHSHT